MPSPTRTCPSSVRSLSEKCDKAKLVHIECQTGRAMGRWLSTPPFPNTERAFTSLVEDALMNPEEVVQMGGESSLDQALKHE